MKIIIRADASTSIGSGHIMRCLTIAHNMKKRGHEVFFYTLKLEGSLHNVIEENGFELINEWKHVDIIIFDHYKIDYEIENSVREFTKKIVVIDDLANRAHDCDLIMDSNVMNGYESRYDKLVPEHTKKLLGVKYLIMRDEFIHARKQQVERQNKFNRLLVFMGGTDPTRETMKVLSALNYFSFEEVHVVCGNGNARKEQVKEICLEKGYEYHEQISYMASLMNEVDFSIGAGGLTTWERCYVGLPSSSTIVADNQIDGTNIIAELGAVINLGWHEYVTDLTYKNLLTYIKEHPMEVSSVGQKGLELTDPNDEPNPWIKEILEMKI